MTKKKSKKTAKKKSSANKNAAKPARKKTQKDAAEVHKDISAIVKLAAVEIAEAVTKHAKSGELAPARYLFEMAEIYPLATDGSQATVEEDCLAKTLLDRLGPPAKVEEAGSGGASAEALGEASGLKVDSEVEANVKGEEPGASSENARELS